MLSCSREERPAISTPVIYMGLHNLELWFIKTPGLQQDVVWYADLADIVQE